MADEKKKAAGKPEKGAPKAAKKDTGAKKAKSEKSEKKPNIFVRMGKGIARFFKGFWSEGKKVTWADGKTVLKNTGVVLGVIVFVGIFVWLFDFGFEKLLTFSVSFAPGAEETTEAVMNLLSGFMG